MIKRLLFVAALAVASVCAGAQTLVSGGKLKVAPHVGNRWNSPMKAYGEIKYTYMNSNDLTLIGVGKAVTYDCAIFIPGKFAGKSINQIGFLLYNTSVLADVKAWVAPSLPTGDVGEAAGGCFSVANPVGFNAGYNITELTTPYVIPEGGCYVGYTFRVSNATSQPGQYPVIVAGDEKDGGLFLRTRTSTSGAWDNYYGEGFGNLSLVALLTGDFPDTGVSVATKAATAYGAVNGTAKTKVEVTSLGIQPIKSLSYIAKNTGSGVTTEEMTVETEGDGIKLGTALPVEFTIPADSKTGLTSFEITITKINGVEIAADADSKTAGELWTLTRIIPRKVVEEEFTATGCMYCPRGIVGMNVIQKAYPENFIGIAVHGSINYRDPMQISDYNNILSGVPGFPSCYLSRLPDLGAIDPYSGSGSEDEGIVNDFKNVLSMAPLAAVNAEPVWGNADSTLINVVSDVEFLYSTETDKYGVAYVLVADSLKGTTSTWAQANYYYGQKGLTGELAEWATKGKFNPSYGGLVPATEMVYNHVAIAAKGILNGYREVPMPIVEGNKNSFEASFNISSNSLVQNKKNLKVVVMLIDKQNGMIVNADEKEIAAFSGGDGVDGITTGRDDAEEVARYSINGQRIIGVQKGLNIIRMSDGTTRKVLVK